MIQARNINLTNPSPTRVGSWYKMKLAGKLCLWWSDLSAQKSFGGNSWSSFNIANGPSDLSIMYCGIASGTSSDNAVRVSAEVAGSIMQTGVNHYVNCSCGNMYGSTVNTTIYCKAIIIGIES